MEEDTKSKPIQPSDHLSKSTLSADTLNTTFFEENVSHVPCGKFDVIQRDIDFGKDRERHWHVLWPRLLRKQLWLKDTEKRPPIETPKLPPHSEYLKIGQPASGGGNGAPWPNGTSTDADMFTLCKAFIVWTMRLRPEKVETEFEKAIYGMNVDAWWTFYGSIALGAINPLKSVLSGFMIDEVRCVCARSWLLSRIVFTASMCLTH